MSKAMFIMDMPKSCLECPFRYKSEEMPLGNFTYQSLFRCKNEPEDISEDEGDIVFLNDIMMKSKPDWCPLRELPEKNVSENLVSVDYFHDLINNTCDQISKATDDFIMKQFERHGYSRDELIKLGMDHKLEKIVRGDSTDYIIDGVPVFTIEKVLYDLEDPADDYYSLTVNLVCIDRW